MAQDRIQLPSSMGGLVRYYDEYQSRIQFKPIVVIIMVVAVIILEIFLHTLA